MAILEVRGLEFSYPDGQQALSGVSLRLEAGAFAVLCGKTGSGKSTLLRCLKPELTPVGVMKGEVFVSGNKICELDERSSAASIGFVMQDPEHQSVMDRVRSELAFGLENLGIPSEVMHRRVAEVVNFFGITGWVDQEINTLSGGQKQIVNLASIIAMQPQILLLDEPCARLDPIAAQDFLDMLLRINTELGTTIILCEHHLESALGMASDVFFLSDGFLAFNGSPRAFAGYLQAKNDGFIKALPVATQLAMRAGGTQEAQESQELQEAQATQALPLNVCEGRRWLSESKWKGLTGGITGNTSGNTSGDISPRFRDISPHASRYISPHTSQTSRCEPKSVLAASNLWFRYDRASDFILRDLSVEIYAGSILGIVGANASGKSTLLFALAGVNRPDRGRVRRADNLRMALMPQDVGALFAHDTLREELLELQKQSGYSVEEAEGIMKSFGLEAYAARHPYDFSGGEQQKAALAKLLLTRPQALLLDEPTKGLDALAKEWLGDVLRQECERGCAIVLVSHDLEFVAAFADRCALLFDGALIGEDATNRFFDGNSFYTTAANRMTRGYIDGCVTIDDVVSVLS